MKNLLNTTKSWQKPVILFSLTVAMTLSGCSQYLATNISSSGYGLAPTERTIAQRVLDSSIEHTARVNIYALGGEYETKSRIKIDSYFSEVLITGYIPTQQMKDNVTQVVQSMPDVKKVYNELWVSPQLSYMEVINGNLIVANIKRHLLSVEGLPINQLHFVFYQDTLYVMGKATPQQRQKLFDTLQKSYGVSKVVDLIHMITETGEPLNDNQIISEPQLTLEYRENDPTPVAKNLPVGMDYPTNESQTTIAPVTNTETSVITSSAKSSQFIDYYTENPDKFN